jgi:hypothetical protein
MFYFTYRNLKTVDPKCRMVILEARNGGEEEWERTIEQ